MANTRIDSKPARSGLFHFPSAQRRDPAVEAWLDRQTPVLAAIARQAFERLRACGPEVRELLHDGHPTACIDDAAFAYVDAFTAHVNLGFFQGAALPDPHHLLRGSGKAMRHVRLEPGIEVDTDALAALIGAAAEDMRARLRA